MDKLAAEIKAECNIMMTKEQLLKPTPDVVKRFYSTFLNIFNDLVMQASLAVFDVSSIRRNGTEEEVLFLDMKRVLSIITKHQFRLIDIYEPTHKRTVNFFRICLHFLNFTRQEIDDLKEKNATIINLAKEYDVLLKEIEEDSNKIQDNEGKLAELKGQISEVQTILKTKEEEYEAVQMEIRKHNKEWSEQQEQINDMKSNVNREQLQIDELETANKKLSALYISDAHWNDLKEQVSSLENKLKALEEEEKELMESVPDESSEHKHHQKCLGKIPDCHSLVEKAACYVALQDQCRIEGEELDKIKAKLLLMKKENESLAATLKEQCLKCRAAENWKEQTKMKLSEKKSKLVKLKEKASKNVTDEKEKLLNAISQERAVIEALKININKIHIESKEAYDKILGSERRVYKKFFEGLSNLTSEK